MGEKRHRTKWLNEFSVGRKGSQIGAEVVCWRRLKTSVCNCRLRRKYVFSFGWQLLGVRFRTQPLKRRKRRASLYELMQLSACVSILSLVLIRNKGKEEGMMAIRVFEEGKEDGSSGKDNDVVLRGGKRDVGRFANLKGQNERKNEAKIRELKWSGKKRRDCGKERKIEK